MKDAQMSEQRLHANGALVIRNISISQRIKITTLNHLSIVTSYINSIVCSNILQGEAEADD